VTAIVRRQRSEHVVRLVAFVLTTWGFWTVVRGYRGIWLSIQCLFTCSNVDLEYIWFVIFNFTWFGILPAIAFVAAYGLFQLRLWGQRLALTICSILFLAELYGVIKFAVLSYQFRDAPVPPLPEGAVEIHVSMWPAYIIGLVSGLLVLLLLQEFVKKACSRNVNA
jgi:uncharacterized membrane protein (DUF2068 family)